LIVVYYSGHLEFQEYLLNSLALKNIKLRFLALSILMLVSYQQSLQAQTPIAKGIKKETFEFVKRDTTSLKLDVYTHPNIPKNSPCIIFVFGGGFITGKRDEEFYNTYFNTLVENKYVVVSISYRLGLKGIKRLTNFSTTPLKTAVELAVEDLYDATKWVLKNSNKIGIDTNKIILSGSSAGAMTVLQADFEKRNKMKLAKKLPEKFQYAGVIAFAGAVVTDNGKLKYKIKPAPTMMFHGSSDKMVFYNRMYFFNRSVNGSNEISAVFKKHNYPYYFYRVEGMGHEVAASPMEDNLKTILWFINEYVLNQKKFQIEHTFNDMDAKRDLFLTQDDLLKKNAKPSGNRKKKSKAH
jgi:dipeptidyl aminopeptidase/acylaminoacyl peptidase